MHELELAEKAGFTKGVAAAKQVQEVHGRLARAFEHYRYVTQEKIDTFMRQLRLSTEKEEGRPGIDLFVSFDTLALVSAEEYHGVPPKDVSLEVTRARETGIFDTMEVAYIETERENHDPIIFGRVNGCSHRFYIAQWGDDVSINDILGEHGG